MTRTSVSVAVLVAVVIGAWAGGCQKEQVPEVKLYRPTAAETERLKAEIENLKNQIEQARQQIAKCEQQKQQMTAEIEQLKAELATLKGEGPAKPRHFGMVALGMVGVVTVLGVIIAAIFETRRTDSTG